MTPPAVALLTQLVSKHCWYFTLTSWHVAGDGNCGYRAIGVGLVVAVSQLSAKSRHSFVQSLQQLFSGMQAKQGLLHFPAASGGSASTGYEALLVCPFFPWPIAVPTDACSVESKCSLLLSVSMTQTALSFLEACQGLAVPVLHKVVHTHYVLISAAWVWVESHHHDIHHDWHTVSTPPP